MIKKIMVQKMKKHNILFFSSQSINDQSLSHRCRQIGEYLKNEKSIEYNIITVKKEIKNNIPKFENYIKAFFFNSDIVIIHRSSSFITNILVNLMKKKKKIIIFDLDDALFEVKSWNWSYIKNIIKISDFITVGSHYLYDYSKKYNSKTYLLPSSVDSDLFHPKYRKKNEDNEIIIGWLGAGNNFQLENLKILKNPLNYISKKYKIKFRIISALSKDVKNEFINLNCRVDFGLEKWVPLYEIPEIISDFDIGVMPLIDNTFSRGKCAMKILEYMSMEIPTVASNIGENKYVINQGINGFLASTPEDWINHLSKLIEDSNLRKKIGKMGRKTILEKYSVRIIGDKLYSLIRENQ